jgi:hypothetical protein
MHTLSKSRSSSVIILVLSFGKNIWSLKWTHHEDTNIRDRDNLPEATKFFFPTLIYQNTKNTF